MKIFTLALCATFAASFFAIASDPFVAPSFVKELQDLEEVRKKARSQKKGVTFLLMEPGST